MSTSKAHNISVAHDPEMCPRPELHMLLQTKTKKV